jgi:hypothetical protein
MFDFSFKDERYLPFEGAGAICNLQLQLGGAVVQNEDGTYSTRRNFDVDTISDVILHMKYTAIASTTGEDRSSTVISTDLPGYSLGPVLPTPGSSPTTVELPRLFSLKHEFPNEWFAYANGFVGSGSIAMQINITNSQFPFMANGRPVTINKIYALLVGNLSFNTGSNYQLNIQCGTELVHIINLENSTTPSTPQVPQFFGSVTLSPVISIDATGDPALLQISLECLTDSPPNIDIDTVLDDLYIVAVYSIS